MEQCKCQCEFKKLIKVYLVRVEGVLCEILMCVFTSEIKISKLENILIEVVVPGWSMS